MNARSENVERFAAEAEQFEQWAKSGSDTGAEAVRNGLVRITRLYLAALDLPPAHDTEEFDFEQFNVDDEEWRAVLVHSSRLGVDYYGSIFDPMPVPPQEACVGSLCDDIADIYRDVVTELRAYRAGYAQHATFRWGSMLLFHWGNHATSAIRAMHCWLEQNDPEGLAKPPTSGET